MKTTQIDTQWIWQHQNFPNFYYNNINTEHLTYKFGQLKMIENLLRKEFSSEILIDSLENEIYSTSAIEGEMLQRSSVRSSINKLLRLGLDEEHYGGTYQIDNLVEIIVDAKTNLKPLDFERMTSWHRALFQYGQMGLKKIEVGQFRTHEEDMEIISGSWEKPIVHYIAPPSTEIPTMMESFLKWLNDDNETNIIIKAAIAHLYFVLIHPFEDGNGRITRAITDYVLAKANLANASFYSIAHAIYKNRTEYYQILDLTCKSETLDITVWIEWFIGIIEISLDDTLKNVETIKIKTNFWDKCKDIPLNVRQKKALSKMVGSLPNEFQGGMKINKYMNLTKSTRITASRDLADLVAHNILQTHGAGRGVFYTLHH